MKKLLLIGFLFAAKLGFTQDVILAGMDGRRFEEKPIVENPDNITGKIVLDIRADKHGHIIYERAGAKGTTIPINGLWDKCENAVKGVFLNPSLTAPDNQSGTIIFGFSQNVKHDTIEYDFGHYNRYIGKLLIFTLQGNDFKGENIISNQIFKAGKDDWPEFGSRTALYKAQNSPFTLADSLYKKEFVCLGTKSNGVSVDIKLENKTTGIFVCEFSIPYCPFQTPEEIEKIKMDDLTQKNVEKSKRNELQNEIDDPCSEIEYMYDNFHYTKKYNTALEYPQLIADTSYEKFFNAVFYKEIYKGNSTYYLALNTTSSLAQAMERGVIIILKNGKRIGKPLAKVETTVEEVHDEAAYVVKSFITLNSNDILLLKSSPLKEFELYVDQDSVAHADILYKMFLCLLAKK
jgi:hypothetical protein